MRVFEVMSDSVKTVTPDCPAAEAWEVMRTNGIHHLVVTHDASVVGMLSDADAGGPWGGTLRASRTVADMMDRHLMPVTKNETVRKAANLMRGRSITALPVVERGRLVGIVTASDLLGVLGGGADRPTHEERATLHHRVAHRKASVGHGRW